MGGDPGQRCKAQTIRIKGLYIHNQTAAPRAECLIRGGRTMRRWEMPNLQTALRARDASPKDIDHIRGTLRGTPSICPPGSEQNHDPHQIRSEARSKCTLSGRIPVAQINNRATTADDNLTGSLSARSSAHNHVASPRSQIRLVRSIGFTLAADAAINIVSPLTCGSETWSSNFSFSGPLCSCSTAAFIALLPCRVADLLDISGSIKCAAGNIR